MNMLENIRRIGMFMIAAQTVMHFAAGKQYEKYMRVITGVIILLMFIGPFVSGSEDFADDWQEEFERMERQIQAQNSALQGIPYMAGSMEAAVLQQIQEEIRLRLDELVAESGVRVTGVIVDLEETDENTGVQNGSHSFVFRRVKVTMRDEVGGSADLYNGDMIRIEEITVGQGAGADEAQGTDDALGQGTGIKEYQHLFAQTLGIADDKVEVTYRGRR